MRLKSEPGDIDEKLARLSDAERQKLTEDLQAISRDFAAKFDGQRFKRAVPKLKKLRESSDPSERWLAEKIDELSVFDVQQLKLPALNFATKKTGRKKGQREFNDEDAASEYIRRTSEGEVAKDVSEDVALRMKGRGPMTELKSKERRLRSAVRKLRDHSRKTIPR